MAGFDAFISYSRRASATLATDLQTAVERFAKPFYRMRAVRVFRDDASMSANTALWSTIEQGLKEAEWFVLLASPLAAQSQYVANEVAWWREHKSADRIIIVLEEGVDIVWDRAANDFDFSVTDSIPRALSGAFAEEPRWIDLRWYESTGSQGRDDPRWLERVADVAATVRGAERDQLIGENVRQHKRAQLLLRGGVAALSLLLVASLVATIIAIGQRSEAQDQRDEAERQSQIALARQLAAQAVSLAPTDLQTASLLAVQAFRTNDDAQTRAALFQISTASPQLVRPLPMAAEVSAGAVTEAGVAVTGDTEGNVLMWADGEPEPITTVDGEVRSVAVTPDASVVAVAAPDTVTVWRAGSAVTLTDVPDPIAVTVDPSGSYVAASFDSHTSAALWSLSGGEPVFAGSVDRGGSVLSIVDGVLVMANPIGDWGVATLDPFTVVAEGFHAGGQSAGVALSADATVMAYGTSQVDYPVWRGDALYTDGEEPNAVAHAGFLGREGMALSADGSLLAAQTSGRLQVLQVQDPEAAVARPIELGGTGDVTNPNAGALAFGGSRYLVSASGEDAFLWDLEQVSRIGDSHRVPVPTGCSGCGQTRMAIDDAGSRAVMWSRLAGPGEGPVVVTLDTGEVVELDPVQASGYEALAWAGPDRLVGFAATDSSLVTLAATGGPPSVVAPIELGGDDSVVAIEVVDDDAYLVSREGAVVVVDLATGEVTERSALLEDGRAPDASFWEFAPDASSLALLTYDFETNEQTLLVMDPQEDRITYAGGPAVAAAYDADSRLVVFDGSDARVTDGGELVDLSPAPNVVDAPHPALTPAGSIVATGGGDGTVSLLDLTRQGTRFGTFEVPQGEGVLPTYGFTPDGLTLVTALRRMEGEALPSTLRTLSLDPGDWIAAACAVGARDLTEEDWARYGVGPAPDDLRCVQ